MNVKKRQTAMLIEFYASLFTVWGMCMIYIYIFIYIICIFLVVLLFELFVLVCCSGICCYFGCQLLWFCYYWVCGFGFAMLLFLLWCVAVLVSLFVFGSWGGFVNWGDKIRIISAPLLDFYLALLLGFGNGGGQEILPRKRVEPYRGESSLPPPPHINKLPTFICT